MSSEGRGGEEEEGEEEEEEQDDEEEEEERLPLIEENLDIQIIGIPADPSPRSRVSMAESREARSLLPSEMEFSNAFALDSDDGEFVATSRERERGSIRSSEGKVRAAMVQRLRSLVNLLRVSERFSCYLVV